MKKIFVGNLDFSVTEESIRSLFEPHGTVESVHWRRTVTPAAREVSLSCRWRKATPTKPSPR